MRDEIFEIAFLYKGRDYAFTVKADLPVGPEPFGSDFDIYSGRKHLYTLNQCRNEDAVECWEIRKWPNGDDRELAQQIGKAIDRYYAS